jgi:hypothetical protein
MTLGQTDTTFNQTFYYLGTPATTAHSTENILSIEGRKYLFMVNANSSSQFQSVIEIDDNGQEINSLSIHRDGRLLIAFPANAAISNIEGDILFVYGDKTNGPNPFDGYLTKLTPDLDTLWTKTYDLPPTLAGCPADTFVGNYFTAIRQTPDGGYIIAGNYRLNCQPGTISDRACLLKVDTAGEVEWWQVYPGNNMIFDIEPTEDSGYVFLNANNNGLEVVITNQYGVVTGGGGLDNTYGHTQAHDLELINDSILAIAGHYVYDNTTFLGRQGLDFFLFNINTQSIISSHYYKPFSSIRSATIHQNLKLQPLNDGFIIAATGFVVSPDSSQTRYKGVLFKLNNNGDSVWVKYYQYGDFGHECQFNDVLVMEDGGFLAVGYHFPGTVNAGAWLVRTDSNGYAPGAYPTGIFKPEPMVSELKLYPNPTSGISWLELDVKHLPHSSSTLKLFNMAGVLVQTITLPPGTQVQEINTQNLPSGLYLVNLVFEDGKVFSGKLVVSQ